MRDFEVNGFLFRGRTSPNEGNSDDTSKRADCRLIPLVPSDKEPMDVLIHGSRERMRKIDHYCIRQGYPGFLFPLEWREHFIARYRVRKGKENIV